MDNISLTLTKAEQFSIWANSRVGSPYLPHSAGVLCTPVNRYRITNEYKTASKYANSICPVICRRVVDCHGVYDSGKRCRWYNHVEDYPLPSYGPLELITEALDVVGIKVNPSNTSAEELLGSEFIKYKGAIHFLVKNPEIICLVFNISEDTGNVSKIGIYNGTTSEGYVVYVKSYLSGVVKARFDRNEWSNYALIESLYNEDTYSRYIENIIMAQNRSGEHVYRAIVETMCDGTLLNIRRKPSMASAIIAQVPNKEEVHVLKTFDDIWIKVMYGDHIGYAVSKYLVAKATPEEGGDRKVNDVKNNQ